MARILNVDVTPLNFEETLLKITNAIKEEVSLSHLAINAGKIVALQKDEKLYKSIVDADLVSADGMAIVWASKLLGDALPERVAGIDLMEALVEVSSTEKFRIYFLGAKREVIEQVVKIYRVKYGDHIIAGYRDGYFAEDEEQQIAQDIASSNADILFVAITSPKKEKFLNKYGKQMNVPFTMGVGGSFDVVSGLTRRAPLWMQQIGLEWFFRFIQEPRRMWKRYLFGNLRFTTLVFRQKLGIYKNPFEK
ncbi:MAG: WecB/TagA/CpsF family glycosyltransferase [Bacteroidota bacterium]